MHRRNKIAVIFIYLFIFLAVPINRSVVRAAAQVSWWMRSGRTPATSQQHSQLRCVSPSVRRVLHEISSWLQLFPAGVSIKTMRVCLAALQTDVYPFAAQPNTLVGSFWRSRFTKEPAVLVKKCSVRPLEGAVDRGRGLFWEQCMPWWTHTVPWGRALS